ncbi:MAG: YCF48-related protein [bacterium]
MCKKLIFLSIVFICSFFNIQLRAGWVIQNSGTSNFLWDACFLNENTGYAVGDFGTIIKTTNGGEQWLSQTSSVSNSLIGVNFFDEHSGWISGHNGLILVTTDGGDHWANQSSGTSVNLFFVKFINSTQGWISSDEGILNTTDGGTQWSNQLHSDFGMYAVYFADNSRGWAQERFGKMFKTTDGGITWVPKQEIPNTATVSFHFSNANTGWSVGYENAILKTTDAGETWSRQNSGSVGVQQLRSVTFTEDPGTYGWIAGFNGTVYRTTNGGTNWIPKTMPIAAQFTTVKFINKNIGWVIGGNGVILKTIDGGDAVTNTNNTVTAIPTKYNLEQNFPNPFNPTTVIKFSLPENSNIKLNVFNIAGQKVAELINENRIAGSYEINFEVYKYGLSSGVYFYKIEAGEFVQTKKMILLK